MSSTSTTQGPPQVPKSTLGLHVLYQPEGEAELDIVAVHGLGGDSYSTWTHSNGKLWLRDLLPNDMNTTRIMTFGYDANVFTKARSARSLNFAENLLSALKDERRHSAASKRRPLFLIGHSLGGIVVKKALLLAHNRSTLYEDLLASVEHLVFFSTPHQGTAGIMDFLGNVGRLITQAKEGSVATELQLWSSQVKDTNTLFVDIAERFTITTFYENEKTRGVMVVNEGSARLNKPKETAIELNANHLDICKFSNAEDPKYRDVQRRLVAESKRVREEAERERPPTIEERANGAIDAWLSARSSMLYLECSSDDTIDKAALQAVKLAKSSNLNVIMYPAGPINQQSPSNEQKTERNMTDLVTQLSRQIMSLLPPSGGQNPDVHAKHNNLVKRSLPTWDQALAIFEHSLEVAPRDLCCIIDGMPHQRGLHATIWEPFMDVIRQPMISGNRVFKMMILARTRGADIFPLLKEDEKIVIDPKEQQSYPLLLGL